jgi:hypothetical protein
MSVATRETVVVITPLTDGTLSVANRPSLAQAPIGPETGEPASHGRRTSSPPRPANTAAAALAMQAYWAASGAIFRYQTLGTHTVDPQERQALAELERSEEQRREAARGVLAEVWDIHLGGREPRELRPVPWPITDHLR